VTITSLSTIEASPVGYERKSADRACSVAHPDRRASASRIRLLRVASTVRRSLHDGRESCGGRDSGTMRRPPRAHDEPLLGGRLVWHVVLVSGLFLFAVFGVFEYALDRGYSVDLAPTLVLNTIVVLEIFHLFFIRNIYSTSLNWGAVRGTPVVWLTVIVVTAAQFAHRISARCSTCSPPSPWR